MIKQITPTDAWTLLNDSPSARLVDVRTPMEWNMIGIPDTGETGHDVSLIVWQMPDGRCNPTFIDELKQHNLSPDQHILFICRSGVRSDAAAEMAEAAGFLHCYNVIDGFEGPPDATGQRGQVAGWQAAGLPWQRN